MALNKYHNVYQIVNDFGKTDSISVLNSTEFDLNYYGVEFNPVSGRFETVNPSGEPKFINNRKALGKLYTAEFCDDFTDYWENIEASLSNISIVDWNRYYGIKKDMVMVIKNFSIYKGTEFFIKFIYDLYATMTTTEFWKESQFEVLSFADIFSNFKNLEYNLSGSLPGYVWESVIKPTVHPAGWVCNYFGNEYSDDYQIVSYDNHLRNDLCYVDYAGCNSTINPINLEFDFMHIFQSDILSNRRVNFQNDLVTVTNGGAIIISDKEA